MRPPSYISFTGFADQTSNFRSLIGKGGCFARMSQMVKQCCSAMEGKGQTTKSWSLQCEFKSNCDTLKGTSIKYKFWE